MVFRVFSGLGFRVLGFWGLGLQGFQGFKNFEGFLKFRCVCCLEVFGGVGLRVFKGFRALRG